MKCKLVDVFAKDKLSGNGLTIFYDFDELSSENMQLLTQEMRQFESIFVVKGENGFNARIFTVEEELDFAGHPLIGLAAHLHEEYGQDDTHTWHVKLNTKTVKLKTNKLDYYFEAAMEQGKPEFIKTLSTTDSQVFLDVFNIEQVSNLPLEVISTGLPYLIIPISGGIEQVKIDINNLESLLAKHKAKFAYILDVNTFEGRTWDNFGKVEDIATGSAAGPAGAFLCKHNKVNIQESFVIKQGRFLGRPSEIKVCIDGDKNEFSNVYVSGQVCKVANINFV